MISSSMWSKASKDTNNKAYFNEKLLGNPVKQGLFEKDKKGNYWATKKGEELLNDYQEMVRLKKKVDGDLLELKTNANKLFDEFTKVKVENIRPDLKKVIDKQFLSFFSDIKEGINLDKNKIRLSNIRNLVNQVKREVVKEAKKNNVDLSKKNISINE